MKTYAQILFLALLISPLRTTDFEEVKEEAEEESSFMPLPMLRNFENPPACPLNEMFQACKSNCSTCSTRACPDPECSESGCDCIPHFYRPSPGEPCQPSGMCPKPECGENEVYRDCGPVCEKCLTFICHLTDCQHKCYCKEGYLRNSDGKCIPASECPKREFCAETEVWNTTGLVDEYCHYSLDDPYSDDTKDEEQCYCIDGFRRDLLGFCVPETLCNALICVGLEQFYDCIPKCDSTCRNYGDPDCVEDEDNCYKGCFCYPGYAMNDYRVCVPIEQCEEAKNQWIAAVTESTTEESVDKEPQNESTTEKSVDKEEPQNESTTEESVDEEEPQNEYEVENDGDQKCGEETTTQQDETSSVETTTYDSCDDENPPDDENPSTSEDRKPKDSKKQATSKANSAEYKNAGESGATKAPKSKKTNRDDDDI